MYTVLSTYIYICTYKYKRFKKILGENEDTFINFIFLANKEMEALVLTCEAEP